MRNLVPGRDFQNELRKSHTKKFAGVFVTASDDFFLGGEGVLFGKKCLCYPRSGDEGSILA